MKIKSKLFIVTLLSALMVLATIFGFGSLKQEKAGFNGIYAGEFTALAEEESQNEVGVAQCMLSTDGAYLLIATPLTITDFSAYSAVGYEISKDGQALVADGLESNAYYTGITVNTADGTITWTMADIFGESATGMIVAEIEYDAESAYVVKPYAVKGGEKVYGGGSHECETACATCGKCLDDCTVGICDRKCGDGLTAIDFQAEDDKVILTMGAERLPNVHKNGYVGNFGGKNYGCTMTFNVVSPTKTTATLAIYINVRSMARVFSEHIETQINGVELESPAIVPASSQNKDEWETFVCVTLGCIQLEQGENEIKFIAFSSNETLGGGNVDKIVIKSIEDLTWGAHECQSICPTCGKCLDATCDESACADKCAGHTTTFKFEAENSNQEGWCEGKMKVNYNGKGNPSGGLYVSGIGAWTSSSAHTSEHGEHYMLFEIYAEEACEAQLTFSIGSGSKFIITDVMSTTVNGTAVTSTITTTKTDWNTYVEYNIATVQLQAGKNVIKINLHTNAWANFDYISLETTGTLSATAFE